MEKVLFTLMAQVKETRLAEIIISVLNSKPWVRTQVHVTLNYMPFPIRSFPVA
jgi:hypothetical protein